MSDPEPDWKAACLTALQQLHEALDVIETIDSECLLPGQLKDLADAVLATRRENERQAGPRMNELFHDLQVKQEQERAARRNRKLSDPGDVPTPPQGREGLPIPASQDPLRRLY